MAGEFWLSDRQWARLRPLLPNKLQGVPRVDDRRVISGIVHGLQSGCRWKDAPLVVPQRRSTIAMCAGLRRACGVPCSIPSARWLGCGTSIVNALRCRCDRPVKPAGFNSSDSGGDEHAPRAH